MNALTKSAALPPSSADTAGSPSATFGLPAPLPIVASTPPSVATTASAGSSSRPRSRAAGVSHRELARHLRVYGGPSLESRRDNANTTAWLSGTLACIAMLYGELLAGWGWLLACEIMFAMAIIAGLIFADAIRRRNKNERLLTEAETAALSAVAAALAEGDGGFDTRVAA